jgi:hypothetical protein
MLEKSDLEDEKIIACLRDTFGLNVSHLAFLLLGAQIPHRSESPN